MNESTKNSASPTEQGAADAANQQPDPAAAARQRNMDRQEARRWWIKLFVQPALLLAAGAALLFGLGAAQRCGFISAGGGAAASGHSSGSTVERYICPMMCTPPQAEPGRCPVCAMELVAATSNAAGSADSHSIRIDPAARRVANIQTVAVNATQITRKIRAVGELSYDEGTLKTIAAYVDGRLERLYADYTGVVVNQGDHLALVYSPRLYSAQVELLLARKARENGPSKTLARVIKSADGDLSESARQRLIELGMTGPQIERLEEAGQANSRLHLCAPISGTVIEKLAEEGQYVKEGQPIYKLADLSTVWLMLELFPEDAAVIRFGQKVEAEVQSLPGQAFAGRVAFIDPNVDPQTRTVGVRVVMPNPDNQLRVGDYAKAVIAVQLAGSAGMPGKIYDPELASKWISPRHPHVIASSPGKCPICGVELVPAAQYGFVAEPDGDQALVVPRNAVLMAGDDSVVYVEAEPGRFEIRSVVLGPSCGDQIVVRSGLQPGEQVAVRGNFLIDSQMQLAGNPSLIDPTKAVRPPEDETTSPEMMAALEELSEEDRRLVEQQQFCPVADYRLGSMGTPIKVDVQGTPVFICCEGCRASLLEDPDKYLAKLSAPNAQDAGPAAPMDLPPIGDPKPLEPPDHLPPIAAPQLIMEGAPGDEPPDEQPAGPVAGRPKEVVR